MRDAAGNPAVLEQLRVQRNRLADRMRPPWWYLPGFAIMAALIFAIPFCSRLLPQGVRFWPVLVAALVVAYLLQWGLARATGIAVASRAFRDSAGHPARSVMTVVGIAALASETLLVDRSLMVPAIVIAVIAVIAAVAAQQANLQEIRQNLGGAKGRHDRSA